MVIDVTAGLIVGANLCNNHQHIAHTLHVLLKEWAVDRVVWVLVWLNSWPAGLKLNTELSQFYADIFTSIIALCAHLLQRAAPYTPSLVYFTGILACTRLSAALSFLSFALALLTAHLYASYLIATLIYAQMLATAASLWNLFRGKHYNVLRHRTDSWQYDIDQLLFGTIIFTLLAFLFPTVLVYYLLFAATRLAIILAHGVLQTLLALLTHTPSTAPARPGDVYFTVHESPSTIPTTSPIENPQPQPQPYLVQTVCPFPSSAFPFTLLILPPPSLLSFSFPFIAHSIHLARN
ncbi:phosphatidylinositol N-acetylglucosaminyltransferase subunit gpi1 [Pleurotus pulmonarius]|nr:phosphatidylinositol N-acetylglucosaminyltransferase subunit gpi1 [Pleurotus pulmonarius]